MIKPDCTTMNVTFNFNKYVPTVYLTYIKKMSKITAAKGEYLKKVSHCRPPSVNVTFRLNTYHKFGELNS